MTLVCLAVQGCSVLSATAGAAISVTGVVASTGLTVAGKAAGAAIDAVSDSDD